MQSNQSTKSNEYKYTNILLCGKLQFFFIQREGYINYLLTD